MYKKLAVSFSVANLCFFKTWRAVLGAQSFSHLYFWKQYPDHEAVLALMINILLLTVIGYAAFTLVWRSNSGLVRNLVRVTFLVVLIRALNGVRIQFEPLTTGHLRSLFGRIGLATVGVALLLLLIFVIIRYGLDRLTRGAVTITLILAPFGLIGLTQLTWLTLKYRSLWREQTPAPILKTTTVDQPRVVWLIFDEMSENVAFGNRPADLQLPNFDRLRTEAFMAANAFPPAGHTTQSMPALLTGQLLAAVRPAGPQELLLTFPGQATPVSWTRQRDIFTEVRAAGLNSALVGWFHPYCRIVGDRLTSCLWEPSGLQGDQERLSIKRNLLRQDSDLLTMVPFTRKLRLWLSPARSDDSRSAHLATYQTLFAQARRLAVDPQASLTLIHLPIPHPPYIYRRSTGGWDTADELEYLDNLALADRALGELRQAMEQAGIWERTTLIISSDHWWRSDLWRPVKNFWTPADAAAQGERIDHRVPFLVRLPGQANAATYDASFNTVLTHDLILEILNKRISRYQQVGQWIDQHKTIGESPYQSYEDSE